MSEPVQILILEKYSIELYNENNFSIYSADNNRKYSEFYVSGDLYSLTSKIGVKLIEADKLISDCIVAAEGGDTSIHSNSTLISYGGLVLCCSDTIFKLTLPELDLEWKVRADPLTCFGVYYLGKDYLIHGELQLTRLDKFGKIVWQRSGRDIWTTAKGSDLIIEDDYILATDWDYNTHKFDYDGNLIEEYKALPE